MKSNVLGIKTKDFDNWRKALDQLYKETSWGVIKWALGRDLFDKFYYVIKDAYEKQVGKNAAECRFENLMGFFKRVVECCNNFFNEDDKNGNTMSRERIKAVQNLQAVTVKTIKMLQEKMDDYINSASAGSKKDFFKWVKSYFKGKSKLEISDKTQVSTSAINKTEKCMNSFSFDIPVEVSYLGKVVDVRCYVVIKFGEGLLSKFNSDTFSFKMCDQLSGLGGSDVESRDIYKIIDAPINIISSNVGVLKCKVYVSPNNWVSKQALKFVNPDQTKIFFGKKLVE